MVDVSSLNDNQAEAVRWDTGPLLVLAGPGSGKTRVLTYRIARLVEESDGKLFKVLGVTFTNRAASEMRQRIEELVPNAHHRVLLTTFHSFCVGILRQHGHHIGLRPDFAILPHAADRIAVLDKTIESVRMRCPGVDYTGEKLLPLVGQLLDDCVSVDGAFGMLQKRNFEDAEVLASIYISYRQSMVEKNQLDFGSIIAGTLELFERNPHVRRLVQRIYPYVCVDEFQDTNLAQYKILTNLVNPATNNLFVVADDDQVIYQWNGADPERIRSLKKDFNISMLQLPKSYRCPPEVITIANKLIGHNLSRVPEKASLSAYKPWCNSSQVVRVKRFESFTDEAAWVARDIASRPSRAWPECVVLGRTRKLLEPVVGALEDCGVAAFIATRKDEFVSRQLVWLHSALRLANARGDLTQLRKVCKSFSALTGAKVQVPDVIADAAAGDSDYFRAWLRIVVNQDVMPIRSKQYLIQDVSALVDRLDFWRFVDSSFAWFASLKDGDPQVGGGKSEFDEEGATWHSLVNEVVFELGKPNVTLNVLLQGLDLRSKSASPPVGAVPCHTIHAAKGSEFQHVYLIGLVEDRLPSFWAAKRGANSQEMQEERRNCFVAITRAQSSLVLTYANEVFGWAKAPSRFLREMGLL